MLSEPQWAQVFGAAKRRGAKWGDLSDVEAFKREIDAALAGMVIPAPTFAPAPAVLPWADMLAKITNRTAAALTDADYARAANELGHGVTPRHMKASKKVEAPRGAFDDDGRPSILFERHVFARNTVPKGRFNASYPNLSAVGGYGPGGYGAFSAQYGKLERAYALDPEAAFEGCSWGAFQVLGENAASLGYESARDMACQLATSEAAHLDSYVRFLKVNQLADKLGRCRAGEPDTCIPFVEGYNGHGFRAFSYHVKFAEALTHA